MTTLSQAYLDDQLKAWLNMGMGHYMFQTVTLPTGSEHCKIDLTGKFPWCYYLTTVRNGFHSGSIPNPWNDDCPKLIYNIFYMVSLTGTASHLYSIWKLERN